MAENAVKKVDFLVMSSVICTECGELLKQNKVNRGHKLCYVCFKISQGKTETHKWKLVNGISTAVETINLLEIQKRNKRKNGKLKLNR